MAEQKYINYVGSSMNPLLRNGDGLHIVPYNGRAIRPGDVIVFIPQGGDTRIVHRVVSVDARGIKTRGDNPASRVDPWVLTPGNILGRVNYIQRKSRRRKILGGFTGRIVACSFRWVHLVDVVISFVLRPVYHRLSRSNRLRKRLNGLLKPRILSFRRAGGTELQLVAGKRVIGRRLPGSCQWEIRRPFRLFVDEELLSRTFPNIAPPE